MLVGGRGEKIIDSLAYQFFGKTGLESGDLRFFGFEFGAEVGPFMGEAVEVMAILVPFLVEGIQARVVLVGGRIGYP